ncbi:MAG: VWA domain-containing protein [Rhodopirellula sp.]|nr:VWA domain-containing protein [Rhodopirellula sp.]
MGFANPLGLLGLLALPAIVAIHLFHRRFPPLLVAGLHLWGAEVRVPTAGRKRERLPISSSLILELLAALLLTMVLAQPRVSDSGKVLHLIAVLDDSASMAAVGADGTSSRDRAVAELARRMEGAPRGSRVTLILTGRRPVMLVGPAVEWDVAKAAIVDWKPTLPDHDVLPALDMAVQLAGNGGDVVFLTDALPEDGQSVPSEAEIVAVGESLGNVAVTAARWTVDSATLVGHVFLRVRNAGPRPVEATIEGRSGDRVVFQSRLELASEEELPLETDVSGGLGRLVVTVQSANDALAVDSRVSLVESRVRTVRVAVTLPDDHSAVRSVRRVLSITPDVEISGPEAAHLLVASAETLPESRRDLWWLGIGPVEVSVAAKQAARDLLGPYLKEKRDPLLEGVSLGGVIWGGVQSLAVDATPVISAGDELLLSRLNGTRSTALLLNVDLSRSNLTESPDWPILINNLVEQRRNTLPGLRRWNYRLNEDIQFRLFEGIVEPSDLSGRRLTFQRVSEVAGAAEHAEAARPRNLARTAVVEIPPLDQTGFFQINDGDEVLGEFAVNFFDSAESDLTGLRAGIRLPPVDGKATDYTVDNPFTWAILAGLLLIMVLAFVDWYVVGPRKSVVA